MILFLGLLQKHSNSVSSHVSKLVGKILRRSLYFSILSFTNVMNPEIWVGGCRSGLQTLTPFRQLKTKSVHFAALLDTLILHTEMHILCKINKRQKLFQNGERERDTIPFASCCPSDHPNTIGRNANKLRAVTVSCLSCEAFIFTGALATKKR